MEPSAVVVVALPEPSAVQVVFADTSPPPVAAASALAAVGVAPAAIVVLGVLVAASRLVVRSGEKAILRSALSR